MTATCPGRQRMYDLLVVGGGINGVAIARDAAGRGFRVLLCEKGDLAAATSSASSKLVHGGLPYREQGDFRLVRESLAEREVLLCMAPHLVRPMRFVLPQGPGSRPRWLVRAGLFLYHRLGGAPPPARARRGAGWGAPACFSTTGSAAPAACPGRAPSICGMTRSAPRCAQRAPDLS